ncbi:DUF2236 domain-containing protein [Tsukamurella sp. NPDC003166]|uniref:DUF2236 domain-containing protein n=1 Tax=Tsukamurella sp. NPDC003166 TaxID=3154444 RepID=UPI0033AD34A7
MTSASTVHDDALISAGALRRRMDALDPVVDHEELTRLSLEVKYGDGLFVHAAYTVAFARQVAVPSIARIVHRRGTGDMMKDVRRRNDDTLVFFGEMLRNGHSSAAGRAAVDRMESIHAHFGITDDDKRYTLASLAFEPDRIAENLGLHLFTGGERLARFLFWRGIGELMGLDVPERRSEFLDWALAYECRYAYTESGRALVDQLSVDWRERWFPGRTARYADPVLFSIYGPQLCATHRLDEPTARTRALTARAMKTYAHSTATRPHRLGRSWVDHFGGVHGQPLDIADYGYRARARAHA